MNLEGACTHIQDVEKRRPREEAPVRRVRDDGRAMGASAHLSDVRRHAMLRLVPQQAREPPCGELGASVACSAEPGERWLYCYADDVLGEY